MNSGEAVNPAPPAPAPELPLHREGFARPETTFEKIGYAASTWLGRLGAAIVLLAVLLAVVIGVPAWSVVDSPSYLAARKYIYNSDLVREEVGGEVVGFDMVPERYRVAKDRSELTFGVQGAMVHGFATVTVLRDATGVWAVSSASFITDTRQRGVHRPVVLLRGEAAPVGTR